MTVSISKVITQANALLGNPTISRLAVDTDTMDGWTGQKTFTYAAGSSITAVFLKQRYLKGFEVEGLIEDGDGYLFMAYDVTINRDDKVSVTLNDVTDYYRVEQIVVRGQLYKYVRLIKW